MTLNDILRYMYSYFFYVYVSIFYYFRREPAKIKNFLDEENRYTQPLKSRFLKIFEPDVVINYNENIDALFYDKPKYKKYMMETNTELERIWKSRVLFENTPRGNIILFYDAYKLGFSYYCDQKSVSYDILNAAAMKYATIYRCKDFFLDETVVPKEHTSAFIKIHMEEGNKEKKHIKMKNAKQSAIEIIKNKFVYLGKIGNFSWIQKIPKKRRVLASFKSPLLESIKTDSNVQSETISYRDFKKRSSQVNHE